MTKHLNRRIFLRGLGGACVAAPFLSSVADRTARAAAPATVQKKLIVMFTHYGCLTTRFWPASSHGPITAADLTNTTLSHLAPYVDKMLIPRGIRAMNEWTSGMVRGQGNDPHTQVAGSFFTCQPVTPNSDDPFSFNRATKFDAMPMGPSLDHVMAKQLSPDGIPMFMRVGNRNDSPQSGISYSAREEPFPGLGQLSQIYSSLTGLFMDGGGGGPVTPDDYAAVKGKSIIDLVRDDLDTLERIDMSGDDKQKLAAWKALLDDTGTVMTSAQCNEEVATMLGITEGNLGGGMGGGSTDVVSSKVGGTTMDAADMYSNLAVLAAVCNANPVIFMKYPGNYTFSGLGINLENHSASHRLNNANMSGTCVDGVIDMLNTIDNYYAEKFAFLAKQLTLVNELENTAAVWFQEMSDGNAHNLNNLPIVQIGSLGGYFKTGQSINVEDGSATLSAGNSESQCTGGNNQVNGVNQSTGTPAANANAPINKYFVNLMNALGMKAGADGYAAEGGSAEVTHFGMYDDTEDFIHGGTNPTKINSPGGFDALKANA
jgi:hypothetical protein